MSEHRVPMLGASWRRFEDPTHSRDPRVRELVAALAALPSPEPREQFRAELRAQLVAIAPRVIAESAQDTVSFVDVAPSKPSTRVTRRPRHTDSVFARLRGISLGRPLAVAASVLTAFVLLFGGAVWMSQKALPGDTLYGLKRASESIQLATAGSDTEKANDYLSFAAQRAEEVRQLLSRSTPSAQLIESTLASSDSDVRSASSLLAEQAVTSQSTSPLDVMASWAPGQLARLRDIAAAMPDAALRERAQSSAHLVKEAARRAQQLAPAVDSGCLDTSTTDDLGVVPATTCPADPSGDPSRPGRTSRSHPTSGHVVAPNGADSSTAGAPPSTSPSRAAGGSTSATKSGIIPIPTLPLPTSSLPVGVSSCGVGVTVGPLGVNLGLCPSP